MWATQQVALTAKIMNIYQQRLAQVRAKFDEWKVDGLMVDDGVNRRWLSGFTGSAGQLVITREQAILATDSRYWEQASDESPDFALFKLRRRKEDAIKLLESAGVSRIGIDSEQITLADALDLKQMKEITWVGMKSPIAPLRAVKTAVELDAIRAAAAITDKAMAKVNEWARPGVSEKQLAWMLEREMRELGADGMAFDIIVAAGKNSARPHHSPSDYVMQAGDALTVDMGAKLDGYHSDMTRAFFLGAEPTDKFWEIYNLTLAAHTAVFEQTQANMNCYAIDAIARDVIVEAGYGDNFGHGLGHGVGLEIHEAPGLGHSDRAKGETAVVGMTVTVEPGIYLPEWGGIRIEDLGVLTENGIELISHCPKTPIITF